MVMVMVVTLRLSNHATATDCDGSSVSTPAGATLTITPGTTQNITLPAGMHPPYGSAMFKSDVSNENTITLQTIQDTGAI